MADVDDLAIRGGLVIDGTGADGREADIAVRSGRVVAIEPGGPADEGGLLVGDVIVSVAGSQLRDVDDLQPWLAGDHVGQPLTLQLVRGATVTEATVTVGERP